MKVMKKIAIIAAIGAFVLASCSKTTDLYQPEDDSVKSEDITNNVHNVFGVNFDPNQDWCTTTTKEVTIKANSSIKKVQVLAYTAAYDQAAEEPEYTQLTVLNQAELNGATTVKLTYDAPKDNLGIFVAFISGNDYQLKKVEGSTVSLDTKASTRAEKGLTENYIYPSLEGLELEEVTSFAKERNWSPNEKLYQLKDDNYEGRKIAAADYDDELKTIFRAMVFSYFPNNDKERNNLPLVKASGLYNDTGYPITTGNAPIIVSSVYKADGSLKTSNGYGYEIYNSDLYYYYFKESDQGYIDDPVTYLKSLPKYKAFPFKDCYIEKEDDILGKRGTYALIYWGPDGTPSYTFPAGYKIGFMVRAKTTVEDKKKQGELYVDGRLNNEINKYKNFATRGKKLGEDGPRGAWLTLNGRQLLCLESGTDTDFNDIILDIEGGVEEMTVVPEENLNFYTYCFEDQELGDYDLNDVVIKANRINNTTVEYSVVACGAYDELYIKNIGIDDKEVHSLFGLQPNTFINTRASDEQLTPYKVKRTVDTNFSLLDPKTQPYIYDATRKRTVYMSKLGEDPHGIMIPYDFRYPYEKICIKDAYKDFNYWGQSLINGTDWYKYPIEGKVF